MISESIEKIIVASKDSNIINALKENQLMIEDFKKKEVYSVPTYPQKDSGVVFNEHVGCLKLNKP